MKASKVALVVIIGLTVVLGASKVNSVNHEHKELQRLEQDLFQDLYEVCQGDDNNEGCETAKQEYNEVSSRLEALDSNTAMRLISSISTVSSKGMRQ